MLYATGDGSVISTENEDNFVRNLATIKVGDVFYTVPLWPYTAEPVPSRRRVKQKPSTSAVETPVLTVDQIKQWLRIDVPDDDAWLLPIMEAAAHLHVQNYIRLEFDDTCGENIKLAMLSLIGHWYGNREAVSIGERPALEIPYMFSQLLATERDYSEAY